MTTQHSRDYDHDEFVLSNLGTLGAIRAVGSLAREPFMNEFDEPLPTNPISRGRARFQMLQDTHKPATSRRKMVRANANIKRKLAEADATGFRWIHPSGQLGYPADPEWYANMHEAIRQNRERLEALNQRFTYEVSAIDPVEPLPALAEDDTQHERQRPPEDIPGTVEQLTDTVVIAPGAPARN